MSGKLKTVRAFTWIVAAIFLVNSTVHCFSCPGGGLAVSLGRHRLRLPSQKNRRFALRPEQEEQASEQKSAGSNNLGENVRLGLAMAAAVGVAAAPGVAPARAFGLLNPFSPFSLFSPLNPISPLSPFNPISPLNPINRQPTVIYRGDSGSYDQQREIAQLKHEIDDLKRGEGKR